MAALAKARLTAERHGQSAQFTVFAGAVVYQGAMVGLSGAGAGAVAKPASADVTLRIIGIAEKTADNRVAQPAPVMVDVRRGVFLLNNEAVDPLTIGDVGQPCYASDDQSVAKTSATGTRPQAGTVSFVDASGVWVKFS